MFQLFKSLVTTQALGDSPSLGGVFTDPNHFQKGTFAGLRMITDNLGDAPSNTITLTNCWVLTTGRNSGN